MPPQLVKQGNGWHCRAPTITKLMSTTLNGLLSAAKPDAVLNIESHAFNVVLDADSCEYDFDIGRQLWLNKQRWSRLIKEYVPREALGRFLAQCKEIMDGDARDGATANMLFRDPDRYEKKHRWGGCLMGVVFRAGPKGHRGTLTFYSRTTYIGYMGFMDAAIANVLARMIGKPEEIGFRWCIGSMQLHCFKTLPYVYSNEQLMNQLESDAVIIRVDPRMAKQRMPPTRYNMAKWYVKVEDAWQQHKHKMLDVEKYGPFRRIKRRWMEHKGYSKKNLPPSCRVGSLDFTKAV